MNTLTLKLGRNLAGLLLILGGLTGLMLEGQTAVLASPMTSENLNTPASQMSLEGTSWVLVDWTNNNHSDSLEMAEPITVNFLEGRVSGSASCNRYMASFKIEGEQLQITPAATTSKACMGDVMKRESEYLAALVGVQQYQIDDQGQLQISYTTEAGSGMMTFAPQAISLLENGTWILTTLQEGTTSRVPLEGTEITVNFTAEGEVRGFSSCNQYMSNFTREGNQLKINPFATTRKACPSEVMKQEFVFLTALEKAEWYEITPQGQLKISYQTQQGSGVMMFTPQP